MGAVPSNVYGNYKLKKVQSQIKLKRQSTDENCRFLFGGEGEI